ncbi:class I SAM-dependent methyltransferase [bacterium]|nr:class I SAM-dependent methyltransferase [bacterium]
MFWDFKSKFYDFARNTLVIGWILGEENQAIKNLLFFLPERPDFKVLDVATGTGNVLKLLPKNYFAVGIDKSFSMLKKAKNTEKTFVNCDTLRLPFSSSSFNLLTCVGLVEYVFDVEALLKELNRVLIKNGFLLITISHTRKLNFFRFFLGEKIFLRNPLIFEKNFKENGFKLVAKNTTLLQTQFLLEKET